MENQHFIKLFDIQDLGSVAISNLGSGFMVLGGILSLAGFVVFKKSNRLRPTWLLAPVLFVLGTLICFGAKRKLERNVQLLKSGAAEVLTGKLDIFEVRPSTGHRTGSISVGGKIFVYNDDDLTQALWVASEPRGGLRVGCKVRIWHAGQKILKFEMASNCGADAP